jgi:hypothetical protein
VQPIKLFDAAMIAVLAASYPLPPKSRSAFLADVAVALARLPEIGPGAVHRVIVETQRKYFDPPILPHHGKCVHDARLEDRAL